MLPDFLSSRYRGELLEFEQVCVEAESEDSVSVANKIRPVENAAVITARSAARWVERRRVLFVIMLRALLGVAVEQSQGVRTAVELRERLHTSEALVALRAIVARNLASLPPPLGFGPWPNAEKCRENRAQHAMASAPNAPSG